MSQSKNNLVYEKNLSYLHKNRIIYRRDPINDKPTIKETWGCFYEQGTNEHFELFNTKHKINTFKYFIWTISVLKYLNPELDIEKFKNLVYYTADPLNNICFDFIKNYIDDAFIERIYNSKNKIPKNKTRKVIFKDGSGLSAHKKMSISSKLTGRSKSVTKDDIQEIMLYIYENNEKITFQKIADSLNVTSRTIYRNVDEEIKKIKKELNSTTNEELQLKKLHTLQKRS